MRRLVPVLLAILLVPPLTAAVLTHERPSGARSMDEIGVAFGGAYPLPAVPEHLDVEGRARWMLEEPLTTGRSVTGWREMAAGLALARRSARPVAEGDVAARSVGAVSSAGLVASVLRIHAAVGIEPSATDRRAIARASAAMPADARTAFADVVSTVASAYERQVPIAEAVEGRIASGWHPGQPLLLEAERESALDSQRRVVEALRRFAASADGFSGDPVFADPEGLVVLAGEDDDVHGRSGALPDPVLLVDLGGDDTYANSAGGACPVTPEDPFDFGIAFVRCNGLAASVVADLAGADRYVYDGPPAAVQGGGGPGGLGLLVDAGGDDVYDAAMTRTGEMPEPFTYYIDGGAQGYGFGGVGALVELAGSDRYRFAFHGADGRSLWGFAQGLGGGGGVGFAVDADGADTYVVDGRGTGIGGFQGVYTNGSGLYAGVGVQVDLGGDGDVYDAYVEGDTTDYYAQGFGGLGGVGVLFEDGGDDRYSAVESASRPFINPLLNCAYGTASYGGVGAMVDVSGDDVYYGASVTPFQAHIMNWGSGGPGIAYGVFVDTGGADRYEMEADAGDGAMLSGYGVFHPGVGDPLEMPLGENTFGTFVDVGGDDTYIGGEGRNDAVWAFGMDREVGS